MRRILVIAGLLFCAGATGAAADCTCRYKGGEVAEGETACIRTAGGSTLARCEKSLNNSSWKMLNQPCPTASLWPPMSRPGQLPGHLVRTSFSGS